MLTYLRWMCPGLCFLTVALADYLSVPPALIVAAAIIGAIFCLMGVFADRLRDARMRATEEELGHYRSADYRRFRLNQRGRAL